jgi:hypothetical protein
MHSARGFSDVHLFMCLQEFVKAKKPRQLISARNYCNRSWLTREERESRSGGDVTLRPNVHFNYFVGTRISARRAIIISKNAV